MRAMLGAGIRRFVEAGNGRILRGIVRNLDREAILLGSEDPEALEAAAAALAGAPAR